MPSVDELSQRYSELAMEEPLDLTTFVRRAAAGEFGACEPEVITQFLRQMEANMLENIETKIAENPAWAARQQQVTAQTKEMIDRLVEEYGQ